MIMHATSLLMVLTTVLPTIYTWHFIRTDRPQYQCTVRHPVWKSRRIQVTCPPFAKKKLPGGKVINICSRFTIIPGQDFTADNDACDIDECVTTPPCDSNATCTNNPGSFTCACNNGFSGDGFTCTDINECFNETDTCADDETCQNTPGSYNCIEQCPFGTLPPPTAPCGRCVNPSSECDCFLRVCTKRDECCDHFCDQCLMSSEP